MDGSDEAGEYCGPNTNEKGFICCTHNRKISEEQMCDGFIDCTRDLSDEFGPACPSGGSSNKTSSNKTVCHHPTFQLYRSYFSGDQLINITNNQLYDGKVDCFKVNRSCLSLYYRFSLVKKFSKFLKGSGRELRLEKRGKFVGLAS